MRKPIVVLESPLGGRGLLRPPALAEAVRYGRAALKDCLLRGEAPVASHLLYALPGVLDDAMPAERTQGMEAGWAFYRFADLCVVYTDLGVSTGMHEGIERAIDFGVEVITRTLPGWGKR